MNIFSKLPIFGDKAHANAESDLDLTAEQQAAQDKAERIEIHRTQVRNGPVKWKTVTAGQQRRAKARATKSAIRKNFKRDVREFHMKQRVASFLRPHLQVLGLLSFAVEREVSLHEEIASTAWIVQRYGRETEIDGVKTGYASFLHDDIIAALETACAFYKAATGYEISLPADYVPAIVLDESVSA